MNVTQAIVPKAEHFVALAVVRSLGRQHIPATAVSVDPDALTFHSRYCYNKIINEKNKDLYLNFSEHDLIMPTDEDVMAAIAKNRSVYSCIPAFPDYPILEPFFDKKLLLDRAEELGVPCPETFFFKDSAELEQSLGRIKYPLVIKPVHGSGGVGISFLESGDPVKNVFEESIKKSGPVLVQEKIPYTERYSVAVLMNQDQKVRRLCVLRALRFNPIHTGPAAVVESVERPDLVQYARTMLESMEYFGIAELEFVIDKRDGSPRLMEINPRFWGSTQGAISAGVDFPSALYYLMKDGDIPDNQNYVRGIRTRNVIFYDYRRLYRIIRDKYPLEFKISSVIEFLKFYKDDAYFIFDLHDMKPFLSLISHSLYRKADPAAP